MELEYEVTHEDVLALNRHVITHTEYGRRQQRYMIRNFRLLVPMLCTAITLLITDNLLTVFGITASVGVVTWFAVPSLCNWHMGRLIKLMTKGSDLGFSGPYSLMLDDDGLHQRSEKGTATINWGAIERLEESQTHAFIFIGPTQALLIPKRVEPDRVNEFLRMVRERLPASPEPN